MTSHTHAQFNFDPVLGLDQISSPSVQHHHVIKKSVENMTVTLIDANHCAGAVMFLFQGYFGCILHTGDFRYFDGMLNISPFTDNIVINTLYLDNTYCDPQCEFPTRPEATKMVLEIIHNNPDKYVVFGLDNLGKEELLYEVAKDQNVPIIVDEFRKKTADLLGYGSLFTTDPEESYISVKRRREVNKHSVKMWNKDAPTIAILPTCLYVSKGNPFEKTGTIFVVPYSDHSCYSELKNFVAKVKPQRIIPVVNTPSTAADSHNRADMSIFAAEKSFSSVEHTFDVPSTVLAFMSPSRNRSKGLGGRKRKATASYFNGRSKRGKGIVFSPEKRASKNKNEVNERAVEEGVSDEQHIERETGTAAVRSSSSVVDTSTEVQLAKEQNEEIITAPILSLNSGDQSKLDSNQSEEMIDSSMAAVDEDVQNKRASKQGEVITPARRETGTKTSGISNIENGELWSTRTLQKLFAEDKAKVGNEALETVLLLTGLKRPNERLNVCKLRERQDETKDGEAHTPQIKDKPQIATHYSKPTEKQTTPYSKPPTKSTCSNHNGNPGNETSLKPEHISQDKENIVFSQQKTKQVPAEKQGEEKSSNPTFLPKPDGMCSDLQTSVQVVSTPYENPAGSRKPPNSTPLAQCKTLKGNEPSLDDSNLELGRLSPLNGHLECDSMFPCQPANFPNGQMESCISSTSEVGDIYKDNETRQRLVESNNVFKNSFQSQKKQASGQTSSNEHEELKGAEAATDRQVTRNEVGNTYDRFETCTCEYDSTEECRMEMNIVAKEAATKVSNRQTLKAKLKTEPPFFQAAQLVPLNRTQTCDIENMDGIHSTHNEDSNAQNLGGFAFCECKQEHAVSMRDAESKGNEIIKNNSANAEDSVNLNESGAAMSELQEDNLMPLCGTQTFREIADEFFSTHTNASNNKDLSKYSQEPLSGIKKDEYLKSMEHAKERRSHPYTTEIQCRIKVRKLSESQVNECDGVEGEHRKLVGYAKQPLGYLDATDIQVEKEKAFPTAKLSESPLNKCDCLDEHMKLKEGTRVSSTQDGSGAQGEGMIARPIVAVSPDTQSERVNKQREKTIDSPLVAVYINVKNEFVSKEIEGTIESTKVTVDRNMQCECANRQSEEILDSIMVAVDPGVRNEQVNKRSEEIMDSPTVAVDPDVQKQREGNHGEEVLGSPMVVIDKNVQSELAKMQSKEVTNSPMAVGDKDIQNERAASKQSQEIIDLPVVDDSQVIAVDRVLQSELESEEIEETTKSLKVAVDKNMHCECADEEIDKRIDLPTLAVDPIVQNKHASKQSNKIKDSPMVAVDSVAQRERASKHSVKTQRNKNDKQRGAENMVSNAQKEDKAQLRSSDREHTDKPVSNRGKQRRKRIYTGDVTFARNVLENYKRKFWNNFLDFGLPDV